MQRNMGRLKNRADAHRELFPASLLTALAKTNAGLAQVVVLGVDTPTMRANRRIRPKHAFQMLESGFLVVKVGLRKDRHRDNSLIQKLSRLAWFVNYIIALSSSESG